MHFSFYAIILAALLGATAFVSGYAVPQGIVTASQVSRSRLVGGILGAVCAVWSGHYILLMMEGAMSRYHNLAILLLAAVAVLSLFYLDHLSARALGGVVLLCINNALHEAFVGHLPARGVFAAACYVLAVGAMVLIGMPWLFRLLLEKTIVAHQWRSVATGVFAAATLLFLGFAVLA